MDQLHLTQRTHPRMATFATTTTEQSSPHVAMAKIAMRGCVLWVKCNRSRVKIPKKIEYKKSYDLFRFCHFFWY